MPVLFSSPTSSLNSFKHATELVNAIDNEHIHFSLMRLIEEALTVASQRTQQQTHCPILRID